jgi:hypothetical protein
MAARQRRIADGKQIGWVAPDMNFAARQGKRRIFQWPGDYQQPWIHFSSPVRILSNTFSRV